MTKPAARPRTVLLFTLCFGLIVSSSEAQDAQNITYDGSLGQIHIGLTLTVKGSNVITGGHYFYAKHLTDIPFTGNLQAGQMTLQGSDGGTFVLKFKGNGSEAGKPLDFTNSVGLNGTWSKDGKQLPVSLASGGQSAAGGRWYENVTAESDAAFEARAQAFYKAVLAGDRAAAAKNTDFPLRVNQNGKSHKITTAAELGAQWDKIFTPAYLDKLKQDMPHDMSVVQGQAMLGSGDVYFGAKGATALNLP